MVVALGLAAVAVVGADGVVAATGPAVVRLTDRQTSSTSFGNGLGGGRISRYVLYGTHGARPIGRGVLVCTNVGGGEQACAGEYLLPRGTIVTEGLVRARLLYTNAVVGGTGLYNNARGTVTVTAKSIKPRAEVLLFRLSG